MAGFGECIGVSAACLDQVCHGFLLGATEI